MHTRDAAGLAGGPEGDRAALDGALVMAMAAAQLFQSPALVREMKERFERDLSN